MRFEYVNFKIVSGQLDTRDRSFERYFAGSCATGVIVIEKVLQVTRLDGTAKAGSRERNRRKLRTEREKLGKK